MKITTDKITDNLLVNVEIAKDSQIYNAIPSNVCNGIVAYSFELSDRDIELINKNRKIYLLSVTFGQPMQPMNISLDPTEFEEIVDYSREVFGTTILDNTSDTQT